LSKRRLIAYLVFGSIGAVLLAAATLYLLASWIPGDYRPARLSQLQKDRVAADEFVPHVLQFGNWAQRNRPFTWSVDQGQLNRYLASMDEIADYLSPGPNRAGRVYAALGRAQLAEPACALDDGVLTLMVRQTGHNKILSVDVELRIDEAGVLCVRLKRLRVGRLTVPQRFFQAQLRSVRQTILRGIAGGDNDRDGAAGLEGVSCTDIVELLAVLVRAIDEKPIRPVLTWPVGHKTVRVRRITIDDGVLALRLEPVGR